METSLPSPPASSGSTMNLIMSDGKTMKIQVENSRRARRLRLVAGMRGITVIVPQHHSLEDAEAFVESKKRWVSKSWNHYSSLKQKFEDMELYPPHLEDGSLHRGGDDEDEIYYLGSRYALNVIKDREEYATISENLKTITLHVIDRRRYRHFIKEWYRRQTGDIVAERIAEISARLNLQSYNRISIKQLKSRWGSCSQTGNLNFNLNLAAAPIDVIDYVIIHELTHLAEFGHSKKFWQLVAAADPEYLRHREWLRIFSLFLSCY